jgi:hypothetical protein
VKSLWLNITAFGLDVVPLVYMRMVVSSSSTTGSSKSSLSAAMRSASDGMDGCAAPSATSVCSDDNRGRMSAMTGA